MKILILNGPNLNLLGLREPQIYGDQSFEAFFEELQTRFSDFSLLYFQSNHEGELVDRIQKTWEEGLDGMVINLGAFTHYSYALYDALRMVPVPAIEVHISHIYKRESFRHNSVTAPACEGIIAGLGKEGYGLALSWFRQKKGKE